MTRARWWILTLLFFATTINYLDRSCFPGAQYHNKTWLLDPARGRYAMLGIHGQFAYFDRPADLMIVGFGSFPEQTSPLMKACLTSLWQTVTDALGGC